MPDLDRARKNIHHHHPEPFFLKHLFAVRPLLCFLGFSFALLAVFFQLLFLSGWLLVASCWLVVAGCWVMLSVCLPYMGWLGQVLGLGWVMFSLCSPYVMGCCLLAGGFWLLGHV